VLLLEVPAVAAAEAVMAGPAVLKSVMAAIVAAV
jgi:hypothetical protein